MVTTEPPLRCICVATGVAVPGAGGEFSESDLYSKIVVRRCGEISSVTEAGGGVGELLNLASTSVTTERGLRFALPPLSLLFRAMIRELREGWYSSVGVGAMLFGVSGNSLSIKLAAEGIWTWTLGFLGLYITPVALGKNPEVSSMVKASPFALRGRGATIGVVGVLALLFAIALAEVLEHPRRWCLTTCLLSPDFAIFCDFPTGK